MTSILVSCPSISIYETDPIRRNSPLLDLIALVFRTLNYHKGRAVDKNVDKTVLTSGNPALMECKTHCLDRL